MPTVLTPRNNSYRSSETHGLLSHHDFDDVPEDPDDEDLPKLPWVGRELAFRDQAAEVIQGIPFQITMALIIVGNAVVIGIETDYPDYKWWDSVETAFLVIFAAELILKLTVLGIKKFFNPDGTDFIWNVFDFFIVNLGVIDTVATEILHSSGKGSFSQLFRMIRLLRILRIFRIIRFLRQLYMLAFGLVLATTAIFWVTFLMIFVLYVCAIMIVKTLGRGADDPSINEFLQARFGNIPQTMLTLFELMTSPDLTPYHEVIRAFPLFTPFLLGFVIFGSFGMIALLTGVISESMFEKNQMRAEQEMNDRENLRSLLTHTVSGIFGKVKCNEKGEAQRADMMKFIPEIEDVFRSRGVVFTYKDFETMMDTMDQDGSGTFSKDEFFNGVLTMAEGTKPISIIEIRSDVSWIKALLRRKFPDETKQHSQTEDTESPLSQTQDESARQIRAMQEQHEKQVRLLTEMMREMKYQHEKQIKELQKLHSVAFSS